ncbi:MAG: hypothetical protein ACLP9L_01350 [Thermoguttaceae bacterium]
MAVWEDFDTEDAMPIAAGLGCPKNNNSREWRPDAFELLPDGLT